MNTDFIRYVPRHVAHHGEHSGYDTLFEFMNLKQARSDLALRGLSLLPQGLHWRLYDLRPQPTRKIGLEAEVGAFPWLASGKNRICHFIYGEDTYFFSPLWRKATNYSVATFHYPPSRLIERVNPAVFSTLDRIIIVGENQRDYISNFVPDNKIVYCPHHVDADFFSPAGDRDSSSGFKIVCVGSLFRDYSVLRNIHMGLLGRGVNIETHVVGASEAQEELLSGLAGLHLHKNIGDTELRDLYRQASVGVLPLSDSTANNALLEMMASGLPVVTNNVGGVRSYVNGSNVFVFDLGDVSGMINLIVNLSKDKEALHAAASLNRDFVLKNYSLSISKERMFEIYRCLL